ncbi:nucleotidyltransferase domain-containing protein [Neomoorella thermoacetica]|uniref:nucleotidyltransferase domain-containing protein n=1 Tax=Neomoorella thermoacetica TaxID=1525 RepID=UPI0030CBF33D
MSQDRIAVEKITKDFLRAVTSQGIKVDRAFFYGSHARGEANENSDIDLIVISSDFSKMPAWRRWEVLGKAVARIMEPVEPLAYTPEEVEGLMKREGNFIRHILTQPETIEYQL